MLRLAYLFWHEVSKQQREPATARLHPLAALGMAVDTDDDQDRYDVAEAPRRLESLSQLSKGLGGSRCPVVQDSGLVQDSGRRRSQAPRQDSVTQELRLLNLMEEVLTRSWTSDSRDFHALRGKHEFLEPMLSLGSAWDPDRRHSQEVRGVCSRRSGSPPPIWLRRAVHPATRRCPPREVVLPLRAEDFGDWNRIQGLDNYYKQRQRSIFTRHPHN